MCVVTFDRAGFIARYPEFMAVNVGTLAAYFSEASIYCDNTDTSIVTDCTIRSVLLNMLVAHIAALNSGVNGEAPSGIVGRISEANEGSVHVAADMGVTTGSSAWFMQTQYGAAYWTATARYRQFQYRTGRSYPNVPRRY